MKNTFRSRISLLLVIIILLVFMPIGFYKDYEGLWIAVGVLLFILFLCTGMRYIISEDKLQLKMWFLPCGKVNIADIISVERSHNPLSSPAFSLKRLCIRFKNKEGKLSDWLISPIRESEFIELLKSINPDIRVNIPDRKSIWRIGDWDI